MSNDSNDKRPVIEILPDVHPGMSKEELDRAAARLAEAIRNGTAVFLGGDFLDGSPFRGLDRSGSMSYPGDDEVTLHELPAPSYRASDFFAPSQRGGTDFDSDGLHKLLAEFDADHRFDKYVLVITDGEPTVDAEGLEAMMMRFGVDSTQPLFVGDVAGKKSE